jgi:hypothetical protein
MEKLKYLLREIAKNYQENTILEVLQNSEFEKEAYSNYGNIISHYGLLLKTSPTVFSKILYETKDIERTIEHWIAKCWNENILEVHIKPDYDKISILNSEVSIIETPWEEINQLQQKLIDYMNNSNSSIDFQNIGNTSRTIMDKLSRIVFDPNVHIPNNPTIDVSKGKFKNQFHTYIAHKLSGSENKELRTFSKSAIDFTENAIDLMNKTTHKLDAQKHFAEVCIISTISVVSLIKAVEEI